MINRLTVVIRFLLKYQLFIFFIFVLSFRLFYASQVINFTQDQARDVWLMEEFKNEGRIFVGYGPKVSVGNFYLAPFFYQLHYIVSTVSGGHPLAMAWFITVIESFTPVILALILFRFVQKKHAYMVAILYTLSPFITNFATFSWNPNLIPFLSLCSIWFALLHFETKHKKYILLFSLFLSFTIHLHYQSVVLFPFYVYVFIRSLLQDKKNVLYWFLGILSFFLILFPYISAEINNDWINTRAIVAYFSNEHSQYYDRVSKPAYILSFLPSFFERIVVGNNYILDKIMIGRFIFWVGFGIFSFIALFNKKKNIRVLFFYFIGILIMLRVYKGDKLDYYMSPLFPLPFILIALLLEKLKLITIPFIIFVAFMIGQFYQNVESKNQLSDLQKAIDFIENNSSTTALNFHFHEHNYINIFAYGLNRYSSLKHASNAQTIVDVCYGKQQICEWNGRLWCQHDRGYTYMALFNSQSNYQQITKSERIDGYTVVIGTVDRLPEINYQISTYQSEYGNDFLLEDSAH